MCLSFHMGCPCTPVSVSFVKLILFLCVHQSQGFVLVGFAIFWFVLVISFSSYLCLSFSNFGLFLMFAPVFFLAHRYGPIVLLLTGLFMLDLVITCFLFC